MSIKIIKPRKIDIDALYAIYYENKGQSKIMEKDEFTKDIHNETLLVAKDGNKICGFISYQKKAGFIHLLFIAKEYQNKGIGTALLTTVIKKDEARYHKLRLLSSLDKTNAHKFYEKMGFVCTREIKGTLNMCKLYILEY